jgi:hypothetical protein
MVVSCTCSISTVPYCPCVSPTQQRPGHTCENPTLCVHVSRMHRPVKSLNCPVHRTLVVACCQIIQHSFQQPSAGYIENPAIQHAHAACRNNRHSQSRIRYAQDMQQSGCIVSVPAAMHRPPAASHSTQLPPALVCRKIGTAGAYCASALLAQQLCQARLVHTLTHVHAQAKTAIPAAVLTPTPSLPLPQ